MRTQIGMLAALALVACGGQEKPADQAFLDATPDPDGLMGVVTGDASESTSSALTSEDGLGTDQSALVSESTYLLAVRNSVIGLNSIVRAALAPIVEIIKNNPSVATGTEHVWGPVDRGAATYRFTMKKAGAKWYGWKLEGKAQSDADTKYKVVMAGGLRQGALPRRGVGLMGIDADALASLDGAVKAKGKLLVGFAHGPQDGRALSYSLKAFTPNQEKYQVVSARLFAVRGPAGGTVVRMATYADISDPKNGSPELVIGRVRWKPGVGGRADGLVFNGAEPLAAGDVPLGKYLAVNSCWNAQLEAGYQKIRTCEAGTLNCVESSVVGDVAVCKVPEVLPPEDPNAATVDPEVADEGFDSLVAPPEDVPAGDGAGL